MAATAWRKWLTAWLGGLADVVWPPAQRCALCQRTWTEGTDPLPICTDCLHDMGMPGGLRQCCYCCRPLQPPPMPPQPPPVPLQSPPARLRMAPRSVHRCVDCARPDRPFQQVVALSLYREPIRSGILQLKFGRQPQLALPLGRQLAAAVQATAALYPGLQAVVPVPLHARRLHERGYNQAARLAAVVARDLGLPLQAGWLQRVRATAPQSALDRTGRLDNLRSAFRAGVPDPAPTRALLVDDVLTTGATVWSAALALRAAGVERVDVAVLAVNDLPVAGAWGGAYPDAWSEA